MAEFKVGEVAILQNCEFLPQLNGDDVEIIGGLATYRTWNGVLVFGYLVVLSGGRKTPNGKSQIIAKPHQLRRRPPKSNDTEWANEKVKDLLKVKPEEVML